MELILIKEVANLGYAGDMVNVKNGYARNFLLPQRLAVRKSPTALKRLTEQQADFKSKQEEQKQHYAQLKEKLDGITELGFGVQASKEGKIYGSITADSISKKLLEKHEIEIDKKKIIVRKPIKVVDEYSIEIVLDKEIKSRIKLAIKALEA